MATGIAGWSPQYLLDRPYFAGSFLEFGLPAPASWQPADTTVVLRSMAGTDHFQKLYQGTKSPANKAKHNFTVSILADSQADYELFQTAQAVGAPVYWCPGVRMVDFFPAAVSSQTYTLSRPLATSVIPDAAPFIHANYPETIYLNGSLSPGSASVSGQTLTAADSGDIACHYTPIHWVRVANISAALPTHNGLQYTVTLEEVILGTFDA
jgi:hypothetical protein